jgi:hypothetical protein
MSKEQPKKNHLNIELPESQAEGTYANLAIISHSNAEFVIDFTRVLPGVPKAKVQSRIIMTPQHTKMLLNALAENIDKFEAKNGEIRMPGGSDRPESPADFFGSEPSIN